MSVTDPIADFLTRIRNSFRAGHERVEVPFTKVRKAICEVLSREGFIERYMEVGDTRNKRLRIYLKYANDGRSVMRKIERMSRPSCRLYRKSSEFKPVYNGVGISILSTNLGVMTGEEAKAANVGGEILCKVY